MNKLFKFFVVFIMVAAAVFLLDHYSAVQFGQSNYWDKRGVFFLFFVTLFPRLTLLFSSVATGGLIWWLGWLFVPRILVATLATVTYWNQNPILVVIAWLIAIGGESSEKVVIVKRSSGRAHRYRPSGREDIIDVTPTRRLD